MELVDLSPREVEAGGVDVPRGELWTDQTLLVGSPYLTL